ncbi:MAG: mechanosensitive ion channel family protein [Alphaproteobacteria bacterium]|nr:mechanosensitive ion channel family protein [Alphaproteobacteria bacterium]
MKKMSYFMCILLTFFALSVKAEDNMAKKEIDAQTFVVSSVAVEPDYNAISKELNVIEETLKSTTADSQTIKNYVSYLSTTRGQLHESRSNHEKDLNAINKRLESLGEMPKDGEEELPHIAQKRKEYNEELIYQKGQMAEADLLIHRTDELTNLISTIRKQVLINNLLVYQDPIVYPRNFLHATGEFVNFGFSILKSPITWYNELSSEQKDTVNSNVFWVLLMVSVALGIGIFLRLKIIRRLGYKHDFEGIPPYFTKVVAAFFVACAYGVIPAVLLGGFLLWAIHTQILTIGFFGLVLSSALYYSLYIFLSNAAIRVVFAPYNPKWRLVAMDDVKAKSITKAFYLSFFLIGICSMVEYIANQANSSVELLYFISLISTFVKAFCLVRVIKKFFWEDSFSADDDMSDEDNSETDSKTQRALRVIFVSSILAVSVIVISLLGYPRLAEFIINRTLFTILIIVATLILRKAVFELTTKILLLNFWVKKLHLRRQLLQKMDFWLDMIISPIFVVLGVLAILTLWGVSTDILLHSIKKLLLGFKIGGVEISLFQIALGIAIFFAALAVVRILRRKLMENVLSHVDIEDGIKHSLASGFGFIGFIIAGFLAIAVMGGDLSNVALVAGALSVGIGLGLQDIVNNFVSGIILLFERPIKVGDWVVINGEEGKIKQINIRSTEIETFNRASVIIPNATILSNSLTNLTHENNWMRFKIPVGVAYGSDTQKVKQILLECANANKKVLKKPAPYVLFQNFGSSSLDFELRGYSSDIWEGWEIPSELRFEINRRFIEEGIEIPFTQMVVHQGSDVASKTSNQFYARGKKSSKMQETQPKKAEDENK